jgi:hypothetical protein
MSDSVDSHISFSVKKFLDLGSGKTKEYINLSTGILAVLSLTSILVISVTTNSRQISLKDIIIVFLISILMLFPHELTHFGLQWYFSKNRPFLGIRSSFPYSSLLHNVELNSDEAIRTSITRNQAIICALAPFVAESLILALISFFINSDLRLTLSLLLLLNTSECTGDFYLAYWLSRSRSNARYIGIDLTHALLER